MKNAWKALGKGALALLILLILFVLAVFVCNRIMLKKEEPLLQKPLGQMVEVDGHQMCVYTEGAGEHTLVFLSGWGTASPVLDFKSLYSLLSDEYQIVVVEKFGYGFSDTVDTERSFDTILRQDREALAKAGITGPFVLCPHSLSGLEAILWAQKYPGEVEAILSLDMTLPNVGEIIDIDRASVERGIRHNKLLRVLGMEIGFIRIPFIRDHFSDPFTWLTEEETALYRAINCKKCLNDTVLREHLAIPDVIKEINSAPKPDVPTLLILSTASGWEDLPEAYASGLTNATLVWLDCGHYVHHFEPERISMEMRAFMEALNR
ncbi:MAG: alpha/beta hydrolase [Clostridia bacterium]|nr:alpha/beta hydrolase [Clostridia bacterium]